QGVVARVVARRRHFELHDRPRQRFTAGIGGRALRNAFLTAIFPLRNVNTSQPLATTRLPSAAVPLKVHSETPRSPATKCLPSPQCASGKLVHACANALRTASRPS